ncbi:MAG: sulfatase-like hydrolase/transferase [Treponema sp.]|nr:sulfatase-like hydrolase/transferase [Treponema sp.]
MKNQNKRPNIITIMTDDQGYGDLSCMGSADIITPHFDRLAASGARFESFYSNSPVCSPSRASLLTGRYPGYAGVRSILAGRRTTTGLSPETPTIAAALKKLGYHTALIGKWHLGLAHECRPAQNGFDYFYGFMAGCIDYYSHIFYWGMADGRFNPCHDLWENNDEVWNNGRYFTDLISDKAAEYIRGHAGKPDPFYLYLGYNAPHYPMHAPQKYLDRFARLPWDRQVMAAMLSAVDDGLGAVMDELERQGQMENTLICFQSDNGPSRESRNWLDGRGDPYYGGTTGKFKGHKFSLFEGGIRVPAIVSWPGHIPAAQVITEPAVSMDLFPTLLKLAGGDTGAYNLDGLDIMPMLTEKAASPHGAIFWEMDKQTAVRKGKYKLVLNGVLEEEGPCGEEAFLADLAEDPGERNNLAEELPELAGELRLEAEGWRAALERNWTAKKEKPL